MYTLEDDFLDLEEMPEQELKRLIKEQDFDDKNYFLKKSKTKEIDFSEIDCSNFLEFSKKDARYQNIFLLNSLSKEATCNFYGS